MRLLVRCGGRPVVVGGGCVLLPLVERALALLLRIMLYLENGVIHQREKLDGFTHRRIGSVSNVSSFA